MPPTVEMNTRSVSSASRISFPSLFSLVGGDSTHDSSPFGHHAHSKARFEVDGGGLRVLYRSLASKPPRRELLVMGNFITTREGSLLLHRGVELASMGHDGYSSITP